MGSPRAVAAFLKQERPDLAPQARETREWEQHVETWPEPRADGALMVPIAEVPSVLSYGQHLITYSVDGFVPMASISLWSSEPGCLKTTLANAAAYASCQGHDFAGMATTQRPWVIFDRENSLSVTQERLTRMGIHDGNGFAIYGGWVNAGDDPPAANSPTVLDFVLHSEPKPVLVFDSLIAHHEGDENSSMDARASLKPYRTLAHLGAGVILLHHSGKAESAKEYRGSSDFKAMVDIAYKFEPIGDPTRLDGIRLVAFKARFSVRTPITLLFDGGRFNTDDRVPVSSKTNSERLRDLLVVNPGVLASEFQSLAVAQGLGRDRARAFLTQGIRSQTIRATSGRKNSVRHEWVGVLVREAF